MVGNDVAKLDMGVDERIIIDVNGEHIRLPKPIHQPTHNRRSCVLVDSPSYIDMTKFK